MSKLIAKCHILLVSSQTSQRSGLRKTLCDIGADNRLIEVAGDFTRAKERLEKKELVHIVITDDELSEKERGFDLLNLHSENNPESRTRIFILMTSQSSPFLMADFVLKGGDCIINKPFKNETLIKSISNIVNERENIPVEEALVLDVQDAVKKNDLDQAIKILTSFKNPNCLQANYSHAVIHEAKDELNMAFDLFAKVIEQKPTFKSLVSVLKVGMASKRYTELPKYVEIWLKNFPIHHNSITDMTKAIIINNKFSHLDDLFQLFSQHKVEDNFAKTSLAAGFVIAANSSLESGETEKAKIYAIKGIEYACHRFQILSRAMEILVKLNAPEEAEKAYQKFCSADNSTPESRIADLRLRDIIYPKTMILAECQKLLAEKVIDPDVYRITINCLKEIGKNPEDMIVQARRNFPKQDF